MAGIPMTAAGLERLKEELRLLEDRRPRILTAVREAREKGDLSENAEYHAAREELGMVESRMRDLRAKIGNAAIVDQAKAPVDAVAFGATVKLADLRDGIEEEFHLVGEGEADPLNNRILTSSPMGKALLTRRVGDVVDVPVPTGTLRYRILEIRFGQP